MRARAFSSSAHRRGRAALAVAGLLAATLAIAAGAAPSSAAVTTTAFHSVVPTRLLDTRPGPALVAGQAMTVPVAGHGGIPSGAVAVVVNLTATEAAGPGFVTAYPSGALRPDTSALNVERAGDTLANVATVRLGADGDLALYASTGLDVVVDAFGYYTPATSATAGRFVPVQPQRVLDTRADHAVGAGATVKVDFGATIPPGMSAITATVTVTDATAPGYWTAWPAGTARPSTSNLNVTAAGQTVANQIIVPVKNDAIEVFSQAGGQLMVDVTGYFTSGASPMSSAGLFIPMAPQRLLDTRSSTHPAMAGPLPAAFTVEVPTAAYAALAANITVVGALRPGFVTAYPAGTPQPDSSSLNASRTGHTVANHVTVALSTRGLALYTQGGADLLVDVSGYYTGDPFAAPLPPVVNAIRVPDRIAIPSAGIDVAVGYGVDAGTLASGPGYWPDFGKLTQPGNVVIGAHRTSNGGPFESIDKIPNGADLWVYSAGARFHYVATGNFIVNFDQAEPVVRQTDAHELTIFACHPPGSEAQRYVVRAVEAAPTV
jgi:LPXTG-site transpeptidase (sortase) family protein